MKKQSLQQSCVLCFMLIFHSAFLSAAVIDGQIGSGEYDSSTEVTMINGGGQDNNSENNYNFTNAYYSSDGTTSYVLVLITDAYSDDATIDGTQGDNNFVKNGVEMNGTKLVDGAGDGLVGSDFEYIYDTNGNIIGWEASWPTVSGENVNELLFHAQVYSEIGDCLDDSCTSSICVGDNCGVTPPPGGGDIPIDGGLGILAAIGLGFGVYSQRSKK